MSESRTVHGESVRAVVERGDLLPEAEGVSSSWIRSANEHRIDPASHEAPCVLSTSETKRLREPLADVLDKAHDEIDGLYRLVRGAGYVVLVTDEGGVSVDHRGNEQQAEAFKYWGTWLGGIWSEDAEGTNGIGTCIVERRPITVHRSQHFKSRHTNLSCSGAPIFAPDGKLLGVIDVSAIDPGLSEGAHALTGPLTIGCAAAIEERLFREEFRNDWILAVERPGADGATMLLAVDRDHRLIGADRGARAVFGVDDATLKTGENLWRYFRRDPSTFRAADSADLLMNLVYAGDALATPVLVTPPLKRIVAVNPSLAALHTRPRENPFPAHDAPSAAPQARGGLSSGIARRIREYVDGHLGETIELRMLADLAGLSVFHFAREFRNTFGITPHNYLIRRRIERASELLAKTELPVSQIALETGFADQGHFARTFKRATGTTPLVFRHAQR